MGIQNSYLFPSLEAGLSRVFNVSARALSLIQKVERGEEVPDPSPLFKTRDLNRVILVKEARPRRTTERYSFGRSIGTKLYFPYNAHAIYDGGKSAFVDDPKIELILKQHVGLDLGNGNQDAQRDLQIIRTLDEIPSLDPFLAKDKLETEEIAVNDFFFQISDIEWRAIQQHVSAKLQPIIDFAYPDAGDQGHGRSRMLLKKLWNTKDTQALRPIIKAFGLPEDQAPAIFSAWKGILYYDYEYARSRPNWDRCYDWLVKDTAPIDFVDPERRAHLKELSEAVRANFEAAAKELAEIFASYESAYDALFVRREAPDAFIGFMRDAVRVYWILGSRMSAIGHCTAMWDMLTAGSFRRRLKYEPLLNLLTLQRDIFEQTLGEV